LGKKLYVGNLPYSITESELRELFERHGTVGSVNVITDRETGRARGFAFVEFEDANGAQAAMQALDGTQLGGRTLRVNEANERGAGGGGGGRGGGGGGGGRGGYGGGGGGRGGYGGGGGGGGYGGGGRDRDRY
jgi:RNA recognition motif-containing protein